MIVTNRGLAEWAIFYTLGLGCAFFALIFAMAAATALPYPSSGIAAIAIFVLWLSGIGYATWRLVGSDAIQKSNLSLAPIHLLQFVLVLFTIPSFVFGSKEETKTLGVVLLTWEIFGALFTLSFLFLGFLARKKIPVRTWLYSSITLFAVLLSVYVKIGNEE